jgi:hypothetical protein
VTTELPETGFGGWTLTRLLAQKRHLESILAVSAGQDDHALLREECDAMRAEIVRRANPHVQEREE